MPTTTPQAKTFSTPVAQKNNAFPAFKSPVNQTPEGLDSTSARLTSNTPIKSVVKTTSTLTKGASREVQQQRQISLHDILHKPKHTQDDEFWMSLFTILMIPVLLLYTLFEIIVKAAPWATGPS